MKNIFINIVILFQLTTQNQRILDNSFISSNCVVDLINGYVTEESLRESVPSSDDIKHFCPNLEQTCCTKNNLEELFSNFLVAKERLQKIEDYFGETVNNFMTMKESNYKIFKNLDQETIDKCSETKLNNLQELIQQIEEITEISLEKIELFFQNIMLQLSGIGCNLCNGTLTKFLAYDEDEQLKLKYSITETVGIINNFEKIIQVSEFFYLLSEFAEMYFCINDQNDMIDQMKLRNFEFDVAIQEINTCRDSFSINEFNKEAENLFLQNCQGILESISFFAKFSFFEVLKESLETINVALTTINSTNMEHSIKDEDFDFLPSTNEGEISLETLNIQIKKNGWATFNQAFDINLWQDPKSKNQGNGITNIQYFSGFLMILIMMLFF